MIDVRHRSMVYVELWMSDKPKCSIDSMTPHRDLHCTYVGWQKVTPEKEPWAELIIRGGRCRLCVGTWLRIGTKTTKSTQKEVVGEIAGQVQDVEGAWMRRSSSRQIRPPRRRRHETAPRLI